MKLNFFPIPIKEKKRKKRKEFHIVLHEWSRLSLSSSTHFSCGFRIFIRLWIFSEAPDVYHHHQQCHNTDLMVNESKNVMKPIVCRRWLHFGVKNEQWNKKKKLISAHFRSPDSTKIPERIIKNTNVEIYLSQMSFPASFIARPLRRLLPRNFVKKATR